MAQYLKRLPAPSKKPSHVIIVWLGRAYRQFALQLPLSQIFHFGVYQIAQAFQIEASLCPRSHEHISPDASSGYGVVDVELHWAMEPNHLLHQVIRVRVYGTRPSKSNREPPAQGLQKVCKHVVLVRM